MLPVYDLFAVFLSTNSVNNEISLFQETMNEL